MNCERCEERHDRIREATYTEHGYALCDDCVSDEAEAAHERMLSDYYGGSGPVTIQERYNEAAQQRRELRKRD
jgi:hypothetical protein